MNIQSLSAGQTYQPTGKIAGKAVKGKNESASSVKDSFQKQDSYSNNRDYSYDDPPARSGSGIKGKIGLGLAWAACAGVGAAAGFFGGPLAGVLGAAVGAADGGAIGVAAGKGKSAGTIGAIVGATAGALAASAVAGTAAAVIGGLAGAALPVALLIGVMAHAS